MMYLFKCPGLPQNLSSLSRTTEIENTPNSEHQPIEMIETDDISLKQSEEKKIKGLEDLFYHYCDVEGNYQKAMEIFPQIEELIRPDTGKNIDLANLHIVVGCIYFQGASGNKNEAEAKKYFEIAAQYNSYVAQDYLDAISFAKSSKQDNNHVTHKTPTTTSAITVNRVLTERKPAIDVPPSNKENYSYTEKHLNNGVLERIAFINRMNVSIY